MLTPSHDLTAADLRRVTGKARRSDQAGWLAARGIPFKMEGQRILALWCHVQMYVEGKTMVQPRGFDLTAVK